jgi:hypothetical protein
MTYSVTSIRTQTSPPQLHTRTVCSSPSLFDRTMLPEYTAGNARKNICCHLADDSISYDVRPSLSDLTWNYGGAASQDMMLRPKQRNSLPRAPAQLTLAYLEYLQGARPQRDGRRHIRHRIEKEVR